MLINPVFNQNSDRPYRWALQIVESGRYMERIWLEEDRYIHWTNKETPQQRDVYNVMLDNSLVNFTSMRKKHIGFLTTQHRDFYEDGKYTEVWNDPVNYILENAIDYTEAYDFAEKRIGNYRVGVRRHITHLGGTISDDELDMLKDSEGVALTNYPLFPPLPAVDFEKPFRSHLITSDVGYIDYIKAAHPTVTPVTDKYAYQSKQSTGFRHFIFDAGNTNMKYESIVSTSVSRVEVIDLETVVDVGIAAAIGAGALPGQTFIPRTPEDDGTWTLINVPGQHMIKSTPTDLRLQMYTADFAAFQSEILLDQNGDIILTAGTTDITVTKNGAIVLDDGTRSITLGTSNVVISDGTLSITMDGTTVDVA